MLEQPAAASKRSLLRRLDALGDDLDAQARRQAENALGERQCVVVRLDVADQCPVQLEQIDRQLAKQREIRIADAEVVQRNAHSTRLQRRQHVAGGIHILQQGCLGDLDDQCAGRKGRLPSGVPAAG